MLPLNTFIEGRNLEILLLAPTGDGIQQISEALAGRRQLQALHIISHGSDGAIELGSTTLDADSLERNIGTISSWANSFTAGADLLIYACDVAKTQTGQRLLNRLSQLTGADVSASDDPTGSVKFGGSVPAGAGSANDRTAKRGGSSPQLAMTRVASSTIVPRSLAVIARGTLE